MPTATEGLSSDVERPLPQPVAEQPAEPALRPILHAHFAADIDRLAALLGRDLSHWR